MTMNRRDLIKFVVASGCAAIADPMTTPVDYALTLLGAMERSDRCILRYAPGRGWGATDIEGSEDHQVSWHPSPIVAVREFIGEEPGRVAMDPDEVAVTEAVMARGEYWACEWWHGRDGKSPGYWLRPFASV